MKGRNISRSNLFLIELIIVILFFAFASLIAMQIFLKSDGLASDTVTLNGAIMAAQTAAETEKAASFHDLKMLSKNTYYDEDWKITQKKNKAYTLKRNIKLEKRTAGTLVTFVNTITQEGDIIYKLESKKYYSNSWE